MPVAEVSNHTEAEFLACRILIMALSGFPSAETWNRGLIPLPLVAAQVELKITSCFFLKENGGPSEPWPSFSKHVIHKAGGKLLLPVWSCLLDFHRLWNLQNKKKKKIATFILGYFEIMKHNSILFHLISNAVRWTVILVIWWEIAFPL